MVKIRKIFRAQYDTRGLPITMDPNLFYRYRVNTLGSLESGKFVEGFLYRLLPWTLIESTAIAIDPFSGLKMSDIRITPANRTLERKSGSVLNRIKRTNETTLNTATIIDSKQNKPAVESHSYSVSTTELSYQSPLRMFRRDTTGRTRLEGSDFGEFEKYRFVWANPSIGHYWYENSTVILNFSDGSFQRTVAKRNYGRRFSYFGYLSKDDHELIIKREQAAAERLIKENALALFKSAMPARRATTVFRNIVELRDLPRSVVSLQQTLEKLKGSPLGIGRFQVKTGDPLGWDKILPNEYLSFQFGWRQLYSDIMDLVDSPSKVARRINRMIRSSGQQLTWSSKRDVTETGPSPTLSYSGLPQIEMVTENIGASFNRVTNLRVVLGAKFRFPDVDLPEFRQELFWRMMGTRPTVTDFYNLIPWTWLVDWYGGLGRYLEIVETMNSDPNLINYGFITASSKVVDTFEYRYKVKSTSTMKITPPGNTVISESWVPYHHIATLESSYQVRKDLVKYADVDSLSSPSSLTGYQKSIITALLLQRGKFS